MNCVFSNASRCISITSITPSGSLFLKQSKIARPIKLSSRSSSVGLYGIKSLKFFIFLFIVVFLFFVLFEDFFRFGNIFVLTIQFLTIYLQFELEPYHSHVQATSGTL